MRLERTNNTGRTQTIRAKKWRLEREREGEEIPDQSMTSVTKKKKKHQTSHELIALKQISALLPVLTF